MQLVTETIVTETTPAGAPVEATVETTPVVAEKPAKVKKEKKVKLPKAPRPAKVAPVILVFPKATRLTDVADFSGATGGKIAAAFDTLWKIEGKTGIWSHLLTVKALVASNPDRLSATLTEYAETLKSRGAVDADLVEPVVGTMAVKGEGCAIFKRLTCIESAIAAAVAACGV